MSGSCGGGRRRRGGRRKTSRRRRRKKKRYQNVLKVCQAARRRGHRPGPGATLGASPLAPLFAPAPPPRDKPKHRSRDSYLVAYDRDTVLKRCTKKTSQENNPFLRGTWSNPTILNHTEHAVRVSTRTLWLPSITTEHTSGQQDSNLQSLLAK